MHVFDMPLFFAAVCDGRLADRTEADRRLTGVGCGDLADAGLPKAGFFRGVRYAVPVRSSALSLPRADRTEAVKASHVL